MDLLKKGITGVLIIHNVMFFVYFFFPTIKFVISIVTVVYTAMVGHVEQFLKRNFIEKHCF